MEKKDPKLSRAIVSQHIKDLDSKKISYYLVPTDMEKVGPAECKRITPTTSGIEGVVDGVISSGYGYLLNDHTEAEAVTERAFTTLAVLEDFSNKIPVDEEFSRDDWAKLILLFTFIQSVDRSALPILDQVIKVLSTDPEVRWKQIQMLDAVLESDIPLFSLVEMLYDFKIQSQQQVLDALTLQKELQEAAIPSEFAIGAPKLMEKHGVKDLTQLDNMLKTANDAMAKSLTQPESKHDRSRGLSLFNWGKKEK